MRSRKLLAILCLSLGMLAPCAHHAARAGGFSLVTKVGEESKGAALAAAEADKNSIPLHGYGSDLMNGGDITKIILYSRERCLAALQPILAPESVIKDGLATLEKGPSAQVNSCVEKVLADWESLVPSAKIDTLYISYPEEPAAKEDAKAIALREAVKKAERATSCVKPVKVPELLNFMKYQASECGGKVFEASRKAEVEAALKAAEAAYNLYNLTKNIDSQLHHLRLVFFPYPEEKRVEELRAKINCSHLISPPASCQGKIVSEADRVKLKTELSELNEKLKPVRDKINESREAFSHVIKNPKLKVEALSAKALVSLNRQLRCLTIDPDDDEEDIEAMKSFCANNRLPTTGDAEAVKAKIVKAAPALPAVINKWRTQEALRLSNLAANQQAGRSENEVKYGLRRLLARYRGYSDAHPQASLASFCENNEVVQNQDREFALKTHKLAPFGKKAEWDWAARYGLSESELSAIKEYTGSYYRIINGKIWKASAPVSPTPLAPDEKLFVDTLNRGLDQSPTYAGRPVKRYSDLPAPMLEAHAVGNIVTYDAFTSTSKRLNWNWQSGDNGDHHSFLIYSGPSGKVIDEVSANSNEGEVLFKAGTRFKVISRKERRPGSNVFDFVMAEVDEKGNVTAEPLLP